MAIDLILGTAGHIDHGKTSLVRALTGTDTDRLPEEKRRGITIELGFAHLELGAIRLGIVDVPGHERFVRQMLAGATGMDLAMLVVAADDSVKPQTLEHLDVLRMLDLKAGVIAITKCDLVDADWIDLVEEELRELVAGTFLENVPVVRTSVTTGEGIDTLKQALRDAAELATQRISATYKEAPFRLAIDRCFPVEGHGTVVTGSVVSGVAAIGDELVIQPGDKPVRVRGLHNHDMPVNEVHRGQRAAINLAGVRHVELTRGCELAASGHLKPTVCVTAVLDLLPSATRPLKHRARVRLHVGTTEVLATILFLNDSKELQPGERRLAQFLLREPVTVVWNQPYIIRAESPVATIGGGRILVPNTKRLRRADAATWDDLNKLQLADPRDRAAAAIRLMGLTPWQPSELARLAGVENPERVIANLLESGACIRLQISAQREQIFHQDVLKTWTDRIRQTLEQLHAAYPLQLEIDRSMLISQFAFLKDESLLVAIMQRMDKQQLVRLSNTGISLNSNQLQLTSEQERMRETILEQLKAARFHPPSVAELATQNSARPAETKKLFQLIASTGDLIHIAGDMYLHCEAEQEMRTLLMAPLSETGLTLSQIRELLGTSRKYAVPFCEYLDRVGFTKRQGDVRTLAR